MSNKQMKTYKNKKERKSYNAERFTRSSGNQFFVVAAITELCDCCTRNGLYIYAFRKGVRKDYDVDTLLAIFHNSLSLRKYAMYLIRDIEDNLAYAQSWELDAVNWFNRNKADIQHYLDNFELYASDDGYTDIPKFTMTW